MHRLLLALGIIVFVNVSTAAESRPAPLIFPELVLKDGHKLWKVVVKSYDPKADRFLLVADGKAIAIVSASIPDALVARLKEAAPKPGSSLSSAPTSPIHPAPSPAMRKTPGPRPVRSPAAGPAADPVADPAEHRSAALARAQRYYRYEFPVGSDAAKVTALDFETDDPEPVAGWTNRYRVQGRAFLEWFDSKGLSYRRSTSNFEVITEAPGPGKSLKVLDFSVKS